VVQFSGVRSHPLVKSKKGKSWDLDELRKIAKEINVSIEVIFRRLLDLGLADKKEYEAYRSRPYHKKKVN